MKMAVRTDAVRCYTIFLDIFDKSSSREPSQEFHIVLLWLITPLLQQTFFKFAKCHEPLCLNLISDEDQSEFGKLENEL